jgi:hypothetical protein
MAATAGSGPVVLLGTAEDEPLTGRIAAELRALGIPIELRVVAGEEPGIDLEVESALRDGARAAVRIDAQAGRTEVSIADPSSHHVALKQVLEGPPTAAMVPVLALRTVEFVRATLLGPRSDEGEAIAARDAAVGDTGIAAGPGRNSGSNGLLAETARLRLAVNSGVLVTPDGLDPQGTIGLSARVRVFNGFGAELMGILPLNSVRVDGVQGSAQSSTRLAGVGLFARRPLSSRAGIEASAGAVFVRVSGSGTPATPSTATPATAIAPGKTDSNWGGSAYGRVGADVALSSYFSLRLDLMGGAAFRTDVLVIDGHEHTAWGRTFVATLGGVEARWF